MMCNEDEIDADELAWRVARDKVIWHRDVLRWHVDSMPVRAGVAIEVLTPAGWCVLRIESQDCGRELHAVTRLHGLTFTLLVAGFTRKAPGSHDTGEPFVVHPLRWPQ